MEKHPCETMLISKEWNRVKPYIGVRNQEAEDYGFAHKAEIGAVRSYIFQHGQYGLKPVCTRESMGGFHISSV